MAALTNAQFLTIKTLQEAGSTKQEIAKYLKMTTAKVSVAYRSDNYDDYKNECAVIALRSKERKTEQENRNRQEENKNNAVQVVEHRQTVEIQATHYLTQELREMKTLLKQLNVKIAYIVEDLSDRYKKDMAMAEGGADE